MFDLPPSIYPETSADEFFKYTSKKVGGFAGLQIRNGAYGAVSAPEESDGSVHFCCDKDIQTKVFLDAVDWIEKNALELLHLSLESFVEQYWEMRDLVIDSLIEENPDDVVPHISNYKDLKNLSGIVAVHIKACGSKTVPHFGIEFGCNWEDEHGAGTSFKGLNLIVSGHASDAFDY